MLLVDTAIVKNKRHLGLLAMAITLGVAFSLAVVSILH